LELKEGSLIPIKEIREGGVPTGITYLEAVANLAAFKIEEGILTGERKIDIRIKMAKLPSDVNLLIDEVAQRYIMSKRLKIDVRGPVFIGVKAEITGD
jgi:O-phosphoseryl-tRNA synthetase